MVNALIQSNLLRFLLVLLLILPNAFSIPLKVGYGDPQSVYLSRRTAGGFSRVASHVANSLKLGAGRIGKHPIPVPHRSKPTFSGTVPALNTGTGPMSKLKIPPKELNEYAHAANHHLGLHEAKDHIMGAAHNEGSDTVHLHSVPRGSPILQMLNNGGTHPFLESKMREGKDAQVHSDGSLAHHAETAAVNQGMIAEKSKTTEGWSVGQAGKFSTGDPVVEPCQGKCQKTFKKGNVTFQNKKGDSRFLIFELQMIGY
ncbi:hypothetical protein CVT24_007644 [Panaeolus cyanescens]|uniref:Uncharacterized protein n=1 Tax=Panaeolus cyanescens TaxID=181874 RepID=A0A409W4Q9_9AGAR|nr:hypothetical protein CVT24_007644 [Panaeolus cyanescens]